MRFFRNTRTGEIATALTIASFAIMVIGLVAGSQYSQLLQSRSRAGEPTPTFAFGNRGTTRYREIYYNENAKLNAPCKAGFVLKTDPTTFGYSLRTVDGPLKEFKMHETVDKFGNKPGEFEMFGQRNSAEAFFEPGKDIELVIVSTNRAARKQQQTHRYFYDRSLVPWLDEELAKNNVRFRIDYHIKGVPFPYYQESHNKGPCPGTTPIPTSEITPGPGTGTPITTIAPPASTNTPPPCIITGTPAETPGPGTGTPTNGPCPTTPVATVTPVIPCGGTPTGVNTPGPGTGTPKPTVPCSPPTATPKPTSTTPTGPVPTDEPTPTKLVGACPLRIKAYVKICDNANCSASRSTSEFNGPFPNKFEAYYGAVNDKQKASTVVGSNPVTSFGDQKPWPFAWFGHSQDNNLGLIAGPDDGVIWFGATNFTGSKDGYKPGDRAVVRGFFNADKYTFDHVHCEAQNGTTTRPCPGATVGDFQSIANLTDKAATVDTSILRGANADPDADDLLAVRVKDLLLDCNTDYKYGWYLMPKNLNTPPTPEPTKTDGPGTRSNKMYQLDMEATNFTNLTNPCYVIASDKDGQLDQASPSTPMPCVIQKTEMDSANGLVKRLTLQLQNLSSTKAPVGVKVTLNSCPDFGTATKNLMKPGKLVCNGEVPGSQQKTTLAYKQSYLCTWDNPKSNPNISCKIVSEKDTPAPQLSGLSIQALSNTAAVKFDPKRDRRIDAEDLKVCKAEYTAPALSSFPRKLTCDTNDDGSVDARDIAAIISLLGSTY